MARNRCAHAASVMAALTIAASSCATQDPRAPQVADSNQDLVATSRVAENAPEAFKNRTKLTDCGVVVLDHFDMLPTSAVQCVESATGTGAELVAVVPTIDDGLYVTYYRGGGTFAGLDIFTDGSRSPYGAFWQYTSCTTLEALRTMVTGPDCDLIDQTS